MIRARRDEDLPALVAALAAQQPVSGYPIRWPLPFPAEDFIARRDEIGAWVAERDGRVVGHVSALRIATDVESAAWQDAAIWTRATGLPPERLGSLSALFLDPAAHGLGLGRRLHDVAVAAIREAAGLTPVLDVAPGQPRGHGDVRAARVASGRPRRPSWLPDGWDDIRFYVLPG